MSGVRDPFLLGLFPSEERLLPPYNTTKDSWILGDAAQGNNTLFDTQWIQCSYQISGGYGHTPRYIYYILIALAMWQRRKNWLAEVAMASVMVYSSSAAIHAVVLAAIREQMAPHSMLENFEVVRVEGVSANGTAWYWDDNSGEWVYTIDNSLWLPVLPMAWDSDVDATLAIVGTAFLVLLPMQIWSTTLREYRLKIIIWLWGALLLMGMISALISVQYVNFWYFPQLRFCPHGANDSLPMMNDGTQNVGGVWDGYDWYHWNRTIEQQFMSNKSTEVLSNICIYPCFDFDWPLRDNTDVLVVEDINDFSSSNAFFVLLVVCYALVTSTGLSSLTIAILSGLPKRLKFGELRPHSSQEALRPWLIRRQVQRIRETWGDHRLSWTKRILQPVLFTYFLVIYIYTFLISPLVVLFFVGFMEGTIWGTDYGGESFYHVGQWSSIVALALVFIAAAISHYGKEPDTEESKTEKLKTEGPNRATTI